MENQALSKYFFMDRNLVLKHGINGYVIHDFANGISFRVDAVAGAILAEAEAGVCISDIARRLSVDE